MTRNRKPKKGEDPLVRLAGDSAALAAELALAGQRLALGALKAEMVALAATLPGHGADGPDEAQRRAEQAEIEAGFDNMPV